MALSTFVGSRVSRSPFNLPRREDSKPFILSKQGTGEASPSPVPCLLLSAASLLHESVIYNIQESVFYPLSLQTSDSCVTTTVGLGIGVGLASFEGCIDLLLYLEMGC